MQERIIPVSQIEMAKPNPDRVPFNKDFCVNLARSIEQDGLLHLPVVAPVPGMADRYKLISGNKRVYAMAKVLEWVDIPCRVAMGLDADLIESAEIAANLFTLGLSDTQLHNSLVDWQRIYAKRHPTADGSGSNTRRAAEVAKEVEKLEAAGEVVTEEKKEEIKQTVTSRNKPFSKILQETLSISQASASRLARISRNLDKDQIAALHANKAGNKTIDALAALGDKEAIDKAIKLIASGMGHDEACRQASKDKKKAGKPAKKAGKNGVATLEVEDVPVKNSRDMTDDEWLVAQCPRILGLLKRKGPFKRDAILYRRLIESMSRVRVGWSKALGEAKSADGNGGFFTSLNRVVKTAHPSQWYFCEGCEGTGYTTQGNGDAILPGDGTIETGVVTEPSAVETKKTREKCQVCYGAAYKVRLED